MTKTQEITEKLQAGESPSDLIEQQGYKRGLVYKVKKMLETTPTADDEYIHGQSVKMVTSKMECATSDAAIEADPEIVELKKDLRKAELQKLIAEVMVPLEIESRLAALEEWYGVLTDDNEEVLIKLENLGERIDNAPLTDADERFQCTCGAKGLLAIPIVCTACGKESSCGWWPEKPT